MSALRDALADYIAVRRALGFKLRDYPWLLGDFVGYLEAAGASTITSELAIAWALRPGGTPTRRTWASGSPWCAALPVTCTPSTPPPRCPRLT